MEVVTVPIDKVRPNHFQPRQSFPRGEIEELAKTIKEVGILQPITVRPENGTYRIIAGERRWRASQFAGLKEIPVILKDIDDFQIKVESLIENTHRSDLEPLEKAHAIAELYQSVSSSLSVADIIKNLKRIYDKINRPNKYSDAALSELEEELNNISLMVGLSSRYQIQLLEGLKLTSEEQKKAQELQLTVTEIEAISSIEDEQTRKILIERAPELVDTEVRKTVQLIKRAPEDVKKAILNREVETDVADEILKVESPEIITQVLDIAKKGIYSKEGLQTRIQQLSRPKGVLITDSIDNQIHNKTLWNLQSISDVEVFTIGYEKKNLDQFVELLKMANVKTLIDARKNPQSQYKPDFNKNNLNKILSLNEITYRHIPELGVPRDIRNSLGETGDYVQFFTWYDDNVLPQLAQIAPELGNDYPVAFMCTEFDPTKCHRHRIANWYIAQKTKTFDL